MAQAVHRPASPSTADFSHDEVSIDQNDSVAQKAHNIILELSHQIMLFYSDAPDAPKDISHLLAPEYSVLLDCTQTDYDMQGYWDYCRYLEKASPNLEIYVINATAQIVNYSRGVVYIPFMMNGMPGNISRKVTHVLKWRKRDGVWTCYGHLGFQGMNLPARVSERDDVLEEGGQRSGDGDKKKGWWNFPTTKFENSKISFLSTMEIPPERPAMSRSEIDDLLMRRFT